MPRPLLLLLGDSLTEFGSDWQNGGWICLLLNRFNRVADIAQRGMGGYTTQWFMDLVVPTLTNDLTTSLRPQLITLWLGANDAALPNGPARDEFVPIAHYRANLLAMVALFQVHAPQADVLLITPPPVDDAVRRRLNNGELDRSNAVAAAYAQACVDVARETGVAVLDLHSQFLASSVPWTKLLADGLHLSRRGHEVMEQLLTDTIATAFPTLQRRLEQLEFPLWVHTPVDALTAYASAANPHDQDRVTARRAMAIESRAFRHDTVIDPAHGNHYTHNEGTAMDATLVSAALACGLLVGVLAWSLKRVWRSRQQSHEADYLLTT